MKICICTQGSIGILIIRKLFELGYKPEDVFVVTYPPTDVAQHLQPLFGKVDHGANACFIEFLKYYKIDYTYWENSQSLNVALISRSIDLLISFSWKYIFKAPLFRDNLTMINCHPGILPFYKGCFSIPWSIINDEAYVGFTYHIITEKIDEGEIVLQGFIPVYHHLHNAFNLHHKVMDSAVRHLENFIYHSGYVCEDFKYSLNGVLFESLEKMENDPENDYYPMIRLKPTYYPNVFPQLDETWDDDKKERYKRASYFPPHGSI